MMSRISTEAEPGEVLKSMLAEAAAKTNAGLAAAASGIQNAVAEPPKAGPLKNRAGESRSLYVRSHRNNPVAWQLWGDEAFELARKENKLLFISIGYSACHWCHVMERESFEDQSIAKILNESFIPIKIDKEERPDLDRIYMNFVQATTGSGGWPLNVFVTPSLEPVFGGTYWPGPNSNTPQGPLEEQVDFLGILTKLSDAWRDQEARCRQDSAQILQQLKNFAEEGTSGGSRQSEGSDVMDLELLEGAYLHFASIFDTQNSGFGAAPHFPTPSRLAFLLRLPRFPQPVIDVVGKEECDQAENMALSTLRAMARGGIRDHIGHGFARYSVTADWSLPHFEKMLYDNAQLLGVYLDAFVATSDPEFLGVVFDLISYLTKSPIAAPKGGFHSSEDADSFYRKGDTEKREGAFYVWTRRELETLLGTPAVDIVSSFYNISSHGNVSHEHDAHDEFINQNVLRIVSTPSALAAQFGMSEEEVVRTIKESKAKMRVHREAERVKPDLDDTIVAAWNGYAISSLARTGAVLKDVDAEDSVTCLDAARKAATFLKSEMYDEKRKILKRVWREGPIDIDAFADDYAMVIEGCLDLFEATGEEEWLAWADELMATQISLFYDTASSGGFFATLENAPNTILRLKAGMDTSDPSTNAVSACNLFRLSSLLNDPSYLEKGKETLSAFEAEILEYPALFVGFMPCIVAGRLGVKGIVEVAATRSFATQTAIKPRGGLETKISLAAEGHKWLRSRNSLLRDLKPASDGRPRIMVCENGTCKEENLEAIASEGDIIPNTSTGNITDPPTTAIEAPKAPLSVPSALTMQTLSDALPNTNNLPSQNIIVAKPVMATKASVEREIMGQLRRDAAGGVGDENSRPGV